MRITDDDNGRSPHRCTKFKALIGLSLLTAGLCAGCDGRIVSNSELLSNAQIITAKDECLKAGMAYYILSAQGNLGQPYKVVCSKPE